MYPVYEYIKGQTVTLTEHMLSATELAKRYGLYTLNNNPNGILVTNILADYVKDNNLNIAEYYYPHSKGCMRVYPAQLYNEALLDFTFPLESGVEYTYQSKVRKSKIRYKYKQSKQNVISMTERRQRNVTN